MALEEIKARIAKAEAESGRKQGAAHVVAVSKLQPLDRIEAVLKGGHRLFGENRVQEAAGKWPKFKERYPDAELHLVGPLQTNKARQAMELFQAVHSVDRIKIARRLAGLAQERGDCPEIFVQVNTGEEPQKSGVAPLEADRFIAEVRSLDLPLAGLMCIPPQDEEPALHFGLLASIAKRNGIGNLSMGMSGDFESAIRLGATHVRIGTAIFGSRGT
ncbi:MAG: YggS family pyridoxal phosphate-dependent enzyme [Albidovulum sp.]|nr:YggS family pyridoxal phosphate-dependent enzyme [Albidovulum sp.]MDE0308035.1 YggS family pyridoxal phosphate-dependent enzyme [Albidovulum sp.]MDE0533260.1 YggS family pyridoxal phosphate-dependent enzyme [Albidovulum sp.]